MNYYHSNKIVTNLNVKEYFKDSVCNAVANQKLDASESTIFYLVNLLTAFTRSEDFFERTENGVMLRPLALIYADALSAETDNERNRCLQRLGDVALFISGLFSSYLNRKTVDLDYYISMGGNAYSTLAVTVKGRDQGHIFNGIITDAINKHGTLDTGLPTAPPMLRFSDAVESQGILLDAGFEDVTVSILPLWWEARKAEDSLDMIYRSIVRIPIILNAQTDSARAKINMEIIEQLRRFESGNGIRVPFPAVMVTARKT